MNTVEQDIAFLTKIYGKPESEIKEKLFVDNEGNLERNEDYLNILLTWNEERVDKFKKQATEQNDKGYKRAEKEIKTSIEKMYRDAGIISDDETYEAVINKIDELKNVKPSGKLTDDDIKKHPVYLDFEQKVKKEYLPKAEHEAKLKDFETQLKAIERKEKTISVNNEFMKHFNPNDYILSEDATRRQNQINKALEDFNKLYDDTENVDGTIYLIKDGKRLEDAHGNPLNFASLVEKTALNLYDKKVQNPAGSAGNKNTVQNQHAQNTITFKATTLQGLMEERNQKQADAKTPEEQMLIAKVALEYKKKMGW